VTLRSRAKVSQAGKRKGREGEKESNILGKRELQSRSGGYERAPRSREGCRSCPSCSPFSVSEIDNKYEKVGDEPDRIGRVEGEVGDTAARYGRDRERMVGKGGGGKEVRLRFPALRMTVMAE
jgi:hypothetical protein